jgi:hypothetical protein
VVGCAKALELGTVLDHHVLVGPEAAGGQDNGFSLDGNGIEPFWMAFTPVTLPSDSVVISVAWC